jgi:cellulose synthase/poly-beta-1,6-N-acetylglucosamine synthase-like glycosyltransferase
MPATIALQGEAPDEIRNVFRQRSRWTKGHMQVFFSSMCPLFLPGLPLAQRWWYTYGTYSYFSTILAVPTFVLVPFLSLAFGMLPFALNWWVALGITCYYGSTSMLQLYCRKFSHLTGLWYMQVGGMWNHVESPVEFMVDSRGFTCCCFQFHVIS